MDIKAAIAQVTRGEDFNKADMVAVMRLLMSGEATHAQVAAFLVGLQMKGVTEAEVLGGATVMRELATPVSVKDSDVLVDTCGTGGSGSNKFNVSTAAAIVASCAGAKVAKHGNRGSTSKSGSADVLEAAGVNLTLDAAAVGQCIDEIGVGFMFAPAHHSAMKHVITARKEIGVRTLFNILGPLTNPAGAPNQVMGVFDGKWIPILLEVLKELGSKHVLIVASDDGLDEISASAPTTVGELINGKIRQYTVCPEDFGLKTQQGYGHLQIQSADESLAMIKSAFSNENTDAADIIALNAGAAIYAANQTKTLHEGVEKALTVLQSGAALVQLKKLSALSNQLAAK